LIGAIALGAEAGTWYVTKQHAQNAADSAAISGAMTLAIQNGGDIAISDSHTYDYRAKQFAAQNGFCDGADTTSYPGSNCASSLPSGTSRKVQIASLASWNGGSGTFVQATVTQQQPGYIATVLGLSSVTINATAVAQVQNPKPLCALGLGPNSNALTIGGSSTITGNGCGLMSDNTVKYNSTPSFSGSGWAVDGVSGCIASVGHCDLSVPYNYNMLPATNPLTVLNTESFNSRTGNTPPSCPVQADGWKHCSPNSGGTGAYGSFPNLSTGDKYVLDPGTYFFYKASIQINGGANLKGTGVTLVLLGDSSLTINGGTVDLSAPATNAFSSDLNGVLIDDQAPNKTGNKVKISGGGTVALGGALYFPNVDVTWGGTVQSANTNCTEVIANTLTINGNAYLSTDHCAPGTIAKTQVVALVH
jgi:hypothetical protein